MGVVYKATDPNLGRSVAIKMMTMEDYVNNPEMLQRFYREAKSTGNLHHRNIVTVYELGDQDGSPYLVMEFLEGQTLDAFLRSRRPLTLLDRIDYILEVCEGLTYAHERSVIHRDIKPGNIMVLVNGNVKIVDFGIAHIGNRTVTRTGQLLGSLPYMSPEQISGKQVDGRTDIFSLGTVFYQLLTSELPFEGDTPAATLLKIMHDQPPPLVEGNPSYPPELDNILLRALAKNRDDRYATAQEFAFDLLQLRGRIQQEVVDEHLNEAESLLLQGELLKTRDKLSHVLKIDRYNTKAVELSRITQQHLERQEMGQRVGELRRQAEEAYRQDQFVVALDLIQQALNLHSTDPDLQRLRVNVQQAKSRVERLRRTIERAEIAYQQGELDSAKQAIEEAIALSPEDAQAKALHESIQRDWTQRARRLQVEGLIEEARREIASRNFTLALKVLRSAEAIDPNAPQLKALIDAAQSAREQEQRRRSVEAARHEIEAALNRDEFDLACGKAQSAVQEFPDDRGLQKLAELAEKQRSLAERRHYIDEQVGEARKLLEVGRTEEALDILQSAQEAIGGDPHVESLLGVVRETLERQRVEARKAEYLRRAKDFLHRKEYEDCIRVLEEAQSDLGPNAEIDDLLQFAIEQSNAEKHRQITEAAAEKARSLIESQDYTGAVTVLEDALREFPDEELRLVLVQARHAAADHAKRLQEALANADSMLHGQRPVEALKYLRSQPPSFSRDLRFVALLAKAGKQVERANNIERELEKARAYLRRDELDQARAAANEGVRLLGDAPEFSKLFSEIDERQAQHLAEIVEAGMAKARNLIVSGNPESALECLIALTSVGDVPAKLTASFSALKQEAGKAKAKKSKTQVEQFLTEGEYEKATALLHPALSEFPQNRELLQLKKSLDQHIQRRTDAQTQISRAEASFKRQAWRDGAEKCLHAAPFASRDPVVRRAIVSTLEQAAADCVEVNWREAEYLLQCVTSIQPSAIFLPEILKQIEYRKQDEAVQECLAEAQELETHKDFEDALRRVEVELERYPDDSRLSEFKRRLETSNREAEERIVRQRDKQVYIDDVEQRLKIENRPDARIQILEEALRTYPQESTFAQELSAQQTLWLSVTSLVQEANTHERSQRFDHAIQSWEAIRELEVSHPDLDASLTRLSLSKQEVEREIRREKRVREKQKRLNEILELAEQLRSLGNFKASLRKIEEGLAEFRSDPKLVEMKAALDSEIRKQERKAQENQERLAASSEMPVKQPEKSPSRSEKRKENRGRTADSSSNGSQQKPKKVTQPQFDIEVDRPKVLPSGKKTAHLDTDFSTQVWRGSALPVEPSHPAESTGQLRAVAVTGPKAQSVSEQAKAKSDRPMKLYAGIAACIIAAVLFGAIEWKDTRRAEPAISAPVQTAAPSSVSPVLTPAPAPVMVRLELHDGKPNSEVVVDNQPKGRINRHGAFSLELPSGDHQIQWTAKNKLSNTVTRHFAGDATVRLSSADLIPEKSPAPNTAPSLEQGDWQRVQDSHTPADIEQFLSRYPKSEFSSEAQHRLEDLYWNAASGANSVSAYNQYAERYPQGAHAQQAKDAIAELDWHSVESSGDSASLDAFLKRHPSGVYHEQAASKLDEMIWQRTKQNDASSLRAYLQSFSEGHHAGEARKRMEEVTMASVPPVSKPVLAAPAPTDERKAVLDILSRYRKGYESHDLGQLREIWPGMSAQQVKSLGDFFAHASNLTLEYHVVGSPTIEAEHAAITFQQSLQYVVNGKSGKDSATVTMHLKRSKGGSGSWQIDSIQ